MTYVDRFAGTLAGLRERLPYLRELGVSYLHLMPLLQARPEPNDGGYAVVDYGAVEPALGTMEDLERARGGAARRAAWRCASTSSSTTPRASIRGRRRHSRATRRALLPHVPGPHRTGRLRATLPDVFPDTAPGTFTWEPGLERWVWTTFNAYQWDLDYANPEVFRALAEAMLALAGVGVDVLRLDAVPFLWKRVGTNCQNQPEVHEICRRSGPRCGSRRRPSPSRPRRSSRRATSSATSAGPPRGQGVRPRLPQRAHGTAVERAGLRRASR